MNGLPRRFPVQVWMLTDWIVGTGEGRVGDVDATVRRDQAGLPFVPAKTLTGIWRDACEQVAAWVGGTGQVAVRVGSDSGEPPPSGPGNPWLAWVDWIFGSQPDSPGDRRAAAGRAPQRAALALSPARLPGPVVQACRGRPALLAAAVTVRPGVAIDEESGTAKQDMLRLEERARPGLLEAQAEFPFGEGDALPTAAEFLLRAGAALVDRLGGKRNRGAGRCWILPPGTELASAAFPAPGSARPRDERLAELAADTELLDDPGIPPGLDIPAPRLPVAAGLPVTAAEGGVARVTWRVTLEALSPLVAQRRVVGNVTESRDFVPGTALLPVILARLDSQPGHRDIVVGDARPAVATGDGPLPGRPVPMTWYRPKDRRPETVNAAFRQPGAGERMTPMRSGHVAPAGDGAWLLLVPETQVSTHAVIGDDSGRPDSERGGVFSYLAIAPGTVLTTDISLPADTGIALAAGDQLRLGRSRKDDFGLAEVLDVRAAPGPQPPGLPRGASVSVWCVSDVLLRDEFGAADPSPEALARELSRRLGVRLDVVAQQPGYPVVHAWRGARRDSFHTRWGRPRPSLTGLAAGSVVKLSAAGAIPAEMLADVERDGTGERTAEGFGQVRFGAPELTAAAPELVPHTGLYGGGLMARAGEPAAADGLPRAPHVLEDAAVRAEIRRQVAGILNNPEGMDQVIPGASRMASRAQWGALRQQLARLGYPAGREAVIRWLDQTREVRQRRNTWGDRALAALRRLLTESAAVWADLGLDDAAIEHLTLGAGRADAVREALWPDAVTVLLTETARTASRHLQAADDGTGAVAAGEAQP